MRAVPDRQRIAETFSRNGWFARCPAQLREALVAHAQVTAVEAGRWIYDTGDAAHGLYGVLSGSVTTHVALDNGESVPISISGPGTVFGYAAQVLGGKRVTTAIARERAETIFIPQHALAAIVRDMPSTSSCGISQSGDLSRPAIAASRCSIRRACTRLRWRTACEKAHAVSGAGPFIGV